MAFPISADELNLLLFEQAPDGIFIDDNSGNLIEVNTTLCKWLGYSKKEFQKLTISDLVGKEILKKDPIQLDSLKSGETVVKDRRFKRKDGNFLPVELTARSLPDGHILVHVRDITQRIRSTQISVIISETQSLLLHLDDLEEIYKVVAEKIHDLVEEGIVITSMLNESTDTFKLVSVVGLDIPLQKIIHMTGFDPLKEEYRLDRMTDEEMEIYSSGRFERVEEGVHALSTRRIPKPISLAIEKLLGIQTVYTMGFVWNGKHLGGLFILAKGDVSRYKDSIGLIMNQASITINRINTKKALHESEEKFRLAFQTSPDSININRMEDGLYIAINDGFTKLTGYPSAEVVGKTSAEINIWAVSTQRDDLTSLLSAHKVVSNFEAQFKFKDGTVHTGLMSAAIIMFNGVRHIISITRDIEEMKLAEIELKQAKEKAEESSRLKTAFLNNISHEVRTPMNAILGFADLLQSEDFPKDEKDRYFGIINSNSRQLLSIIDDVLEISRMDSGRIPVNTSKFSLSELMDDIHLSMSELAAKKGLKFLCNINDDPENDKIIADREKIRQVISGLIGNAIKYTPSGEINFGFKIKEEIVEFYVRDTGIGIEPSEVDKIFERFYQVKHRGTHDARGTGLGLSIAKGLAEMMGGEIHVDSVVDEGSVFSFTLPIMKVEKVLSSHEPAGTSFSLSELTILVVEDEADNFEYLQILLSRKVKKVLWARNGAEVLPLLRTDFPDLVLMDLKMPVMNGIEATLQLKKRYPDLPVIALTAYTQPEDERNAIQAGCAAFVRKPIRHQELFEAIRRVIS